MTEEQYGILMKAVGRIEGRQDEIKSNQAGQSQKLDIALETLQSHLDRHRTGGRILKWSGSVITFIAGLWWRFRG
jgi:hypothetical protein